MFKQFTEHITGTQQYLLFSLSIFMVFFIVVSVLLIRLKKQHVEHMSGMPLNDNTLETEKNMQP
ncbi:hypothetical protein IDJ75_03665 [Mucilaginibacter rigui]|jgi:hypothetical protein|uniref:CcoQ/FixQ family Cbb3-type cytochrome c oxidase assembly chaperone n=1 Tax=Mucilaginibacter rigui TaxID=534635 RepID=A0ABR7X1A5_9SPHI|nr:hypothetical protein [Mucilaginibacter rigui]MBD1384363.1 hypothetical protein [Mucilaginibacter rigui]